MGRDGHRHRHPAAWSCGELLLSDVPHEFPRAGARDQRTEGTPTVRRPLRRLRGRERWPHVTYVEVIAAVDSSVAPTPLMIDVPVTQGGHWRIEPRAYAEAAAHVPSGFRPPRLRAPLSRPVPIERATDEPFEQRFEISTRIAYRREQRLVERFARQLRAKGHLVTRHAITLPDGTELRSDLFDHQSHLLVEAKANADRASIRMAIGRLLDYSRFVTPEPKALAVSLPCVRRWISSSCSTATASR